MGSTWTRTIGLALALALSACGGGDPEPAQPGPEATGGGERTAESGGGMQVSGLMGTIPSRKVEAALEPKLGSMQRCFMRGAQQLEFLAGGMEFYFRVGRGGAVEWVIPRGSSIGHRATEQCLLDVARATRFPEPQGGDAAEVSWSFEIDGPEDVRPPVAWDAAELDPLLAERRAELEGCGLTGGALTITAYVAPGGALMAAGAAAGSPEAAAQIDCALAALAGWPLPDPGSYPAKVTFSAP